MLEWTPVSATHCVVVIIEFSDGGPADETLMFKGTLDECKRTCELMPAVSYSGDRPTSGARACIYPLAEGAN